MNQLDARQQDQNDGSDALVAAPGRPGVLARLRRRDRRNAPGPVPAAARVWLNRAADRHRLMRRLRRLALELDVLGAPAPLVNRTRGAALDAHRQHMVCHEIALRLGSSEADLGDVAELLDLTELDVPVRSVAELARTVLRWGVLVDGASLAGLVSGTETAAPELVSDLQELTLIELRRIGLAGAVVAWCLSQQPEVVAVALTDELAAPPGALDGENLADIDSATRRRAGLPDDLAIAAAWLQSRDGASSWVHQQLGAFADC